MWPRPRIRIGELESSLLRGNAAGDPFTRDVAVYLPPGYDATPAARYPTIYVLAGFTGRGVGLLHDRFLAPSLPERMDRLIAAGQARPAILVLPDCITRFGGSQYINSPATGRYEDHLIEELVPWVDRNFRTRPAREHRAVLGKSSGGYGALVLGMRHPDVFGALGSHAGDCAFELCYRCDIPAAVAGLAGFGGSVERFFAALPSLDPPGPAHFAALNLIAMAACYSPRPDAPLGLELPFDTTTGELDERVWRRWLEHDPLHLAPRHAEALRSLKLLYLDAGTSDEYHLHLGARMLCRRFDAQGVRYVHEEFAGGHRNIDFRYDRSLALLSAAIS